LEDMAISPAAISGNGFWSGRRVFITGHTGFKGAWLCIWLSRLGARITGYALDPPTSPSLFELAKVSDLLHHHYIADVRDAERLRQAIAEDEPEIVIHMAAQPLVRDSYSIPVATYEINVMGTVNLLEAIRSCASVRAVVNVTTDKCYENHEQNRGYSEDDRLGGYDPYSSSKACSELVAAAYRSSFFNPNFFESHRVAIATARAGNVIGGGDWATDRLIPDCIRSLLEGEEIIVRNPAAVRPWQHVLEPLSGYLQLAERLYSDGLVCAGPWNFGPLDGDVKSVEWIVQRLCSLWGDGAYLVDRGGHPHETGFLSLDSSKAVMQLPWYPRWNLDQALNSIITWTLAYRQGMDMRLECRRQIEQYEADE